MKTEEREKKVVEMAKKLMKLDESERAYISGYMEGKEEERLKWERKREQTVTV